MGAGALAATDQPKRSSQSIAESGALPAIPLAVLARDWGECERQRCLLEIPADERVEPLRWHALVAALARDAVKKTTWREAFDRSTLITWHPSGLPLLKALTRQRYIYLCWGAGHLTGVKKWAMRILMRRASLVIVNEGVTAGEIRALSGAEAVQMPYLVDAGFYRPAEKQGSADYLFCPGTNARDPEILLALAMRGHRVKWLCNTAELIERYGDVHPRLEILTNLDFVELRRAYQNAAMVVLPLENDIHAAGQTTAMEGVACGRPVLLSNGRTAEIFKADDLVTIVDSGDPEIWQRTITAMQEQVTAETFDAEATRQRLIEKHDFYAIWPRYARLFQDRLAQ